MTKLSPEDASMLALIAENQDSPERVQKLMKRPKSAKARRIAKIMTKRPVKDASKSERQAAAAIRGWAATNKSARSK